MTRCDPREDMRRSVEFAYAAIRERVAKGRSGWGGYGPRRKSPPPGPSEIAGPRTFVRTNGAGR
jgi:hypothetical protein